MKYLPTFFKSFAKLLVSQGKIKSMRKATTFQISHIFETLQRLFYFLFHFDVKRTRNLFDKLRTGDENAWEKVCFQTKTF